MTDHRAQARVISFNIKVATETSLTHIGRDLCAMKADLCALQEVGVHWSMGAKVNQLAYLTSAQGHQSTSWLPLLERSWLEDPYRGGPFIFHGLSSDQTLGTQAGHFGIGISAHGVFEQKKVHYLPRAEDEQRGIQQVTWRQSHAPHRPLMVFNTHLSVNSAEQLVQIDALIKSCKDLKGPMLLLGDLNAQPESRILSRLYDHGWEDLYLQANPDPYEEPRLTFSTLKPHRCIDYILGRGVTCLSAGIARHIKSSDHFPIWAEITW